MIKWIFIIAGILFVMFIFWCFIRAGALEDREREKLLHQDSMNNLTNETYVLSDLEKQTVDKLLSEFNNNMDK